MIHLSGIGALNCRELTCSRSRNVEIKGRIVTSGNEPKASRAQRATPDSRVYNLDKTKIGVKARSIQSLIQHLRFETTSETRNFTF